MSFSLHIVGNPTGPGPLEMCNYCERDNRLWEKAKDKMYKAMKKNALLQAITLCQDNPAQQHVKKSDNVN